ncbi:hypothetical protein PF002_g30368 [Phytophthora fragariae]|uniref:Uncharacterized protein n=1 Tax=Phytophthora fragariae TaxID=53985 RepID=A0A6A3HHW4_9STRA|nr:hypothetical protein PF011_g26713 [Phytophthora fragariae]KAE9169392.1 hypothetical protein PF002_g30368 [Phytophthora fragariae]
MALVQLVLPTDPGALPLADRKVRFRLESAVKGKMLP